MTITADMQQLKQRMRSTWMAGDFGRIAQYSTKVADEFVERLNIVSGIKMLDVACGTGNTAIAAARKGAHVTGVDIAPNLLEQARKRASAEGLSAKFDEGDAENLPYQNAQYDLVISMFGAMFAPRPEQVAAELGRVCRPGGRIAMANWTPGGLAGKMFALTARFIPPPEGIPAPVLWGDEGVVRKRLGGIASRIDTTRRRIEMEFPFPPREVVQLFRDYFGPTQVAFSRLDPKQQAAYAAELENLWSEHNQGSGGKTVAPNEYLEVIATRA
jgi:SAM-dependent methyltransferase